jgi:hypothetical protein
MGGDAGAPNDAGTSMSVSDPSQNDPSLPEGQNVEKKGTNDHQAREATKDKKENGDVQTDEYQNEGVSGNAWSFKDPVTLYTCLGVIGLIFGLALSIATYCVYKKEQESQAGGKKAEQSSVEMPDAKSPGAMVIGS